MGRCSVHSEAHVLRALNTRCVCVTCGAFSRNEEEMEELDSEIVAPRNSSGGKAGATARRALPMKRAREPETVGKKDKQDGGRAATITAMRKGSAAAGLARFRRRHTADDVTDPERAAGIRR
jgi:hypothetical protein